MDGLAGKLPPNAISPARAEQVTAFIRNYASVHGLPQPAAPPPVEVHPPPPVYLPATHSKKGVFKEYKKNTIENTEAVSYSAFCKLLNVYAADVVLMKPRTDVCVHCDKLREQMKLSRNEEELSEAAKALARHLETAQEEWQYYRDSIDTARENATTCHLTFDFAQQLELPYYVRQVGPLYFKLYFKVCSCSESKQTKQTKQTKQSDAFTHKVFMSEGVIAPVLCTATWN